MTHGQAKPSGYQATKSSAPNKTYRDLSPTSGYLRRLLQSNLIPRQTLVRFCQTLSQVGHQSQSGRHIGYRPHDPDPQVVSEALVQAGLLTAWQDRALRGGRTSFRVGPYTLLQPLAAGRTSVVFLAEHQVLRRRVALKLLQSTVRADLEKLTQFFGRYRTAPALDHPNLIRVWELHQIGNRYYVVMEYLAGSDLERLVAEYGPLGFQQAASIAAEVATGLAHAHCYGLVHGDVKLSNVLVDWQGRVKLTDFGLLLVPDRQGPATAMTRTVLGTPAYAAPEQLLNLEKVTEKADVYALGGLLLTLLTGRQPFEASSLVELMFKHHSEPPLDPRHWQPRIPTLMLDLMSRMLAKKPQHRPAAAEVAAVLRRLASQPSPPSESRVGSAASEIAENAGLQASRPVPSPQPALLIPEPGSPSPWRNALPETWQAALTQEDCQSSTQAGSDPQTDVEVNATESPMPTPSPTLQVTGVL